MELDPNNPEHMAAVARVSGKRNATEAFQPESAPPNVSHKLRALIASVASGLVYFINWLATVPPEQQAGWLAQLVEITPVQYRPSVGLFTRFAGFALAVYATMQASKAGPSKPNP